MNKTQIAKLEGGFVKLRPPAKNEEGKIRDDDWFVVAVEDGLIRLSNQNTFETLLLGFDHIYSYMSDASRGLGTLYGFLQLHSQVWLRDQRGIAEPLPPPRTTQDLVTEALKSSNRQGREMKESLAIATQAADAASKAAHASFASLRPWLSCKVNVAGPLTYKATGDAQFDFRMIVKNVGQTPAQGVRLEPGLNLMSPKHEHTIVKLLKMAEHNRAMPVGVGAVLLPGAIPIGGAELGLVLFPEETYTFSWRIPIRRDEIQRACEDIKPHAHFWPEVFGLVSYTYPLATVRADTGFMYCIEKALADGTRGAVLELDEPVLLENLRLIDHSLWSGFAT